MYRELLFKITNVCIQLKSLKWYEMGKRTCMNLTNGLDKNGKWLWLQKGKMGIVIRDLFDGWDPAQIMDSRQLEWAVSDQNIAICDD